MTSVTIQLPDELPSSLHRSPIELERDVKLAAAIDWYRRGLVSQGRAAEIAGIARADFIDALAERKIDVVQVEPDELEQEVNRARAGRR
jgi:predicted HTH domain antitoxin